MNAITPKSAESDAQVQAVLALWSAPRPANDRKAGFDRKLVGAPGCKRIDEEVFLRPESLGFDAE